jgi:hypothetical protein
MEYSYIDKLYSDRVFGPVYRNLGRYIKRGIAHLHHSWSKVVLVFVSPAQGGQHSYPTIRSRLIYDEASTQPAETFSTNETPLKHANLPSSRQIGTRKTQNEQQPDPA